MLIRCVNIISHDMNVLDPFQFAHLSITYRVPFWSSSSDRSATGGSKATRIFSALCRKTGGISEKLEGVARDASLYSSGVIERGGESIIVTAGMLTSF